MSAERLRDVFTNVASFCYPGTMRKLERSCHAFRDSVAATTETLAIPFIFTDPACHQTCCGLYYFRTDSVVVHGVLPTTVRIRTGKSVTRDIAEEDAEKLVKQCLAIIDAAPAGVTDFVDEDQDSPDDGKQYPPTTDVWGNRIRFTRTRDQESGISVASRKRSTFFVLASMRGYCNTVYEALRRQLDTDVMVQIHDTVQVEGLDGGTETISKTPPYRKNTVWADFSGRDASPSKFSASGMTTAVDLRQPGAVDLVQRAVHRHIQKVFAPPVPKAPIGTNVAAGYDKAASYAIVSPALAKLQMGMDPWMVADRPPAAVLEDLDGCDNATPYDPVKANEIFVNWSTVSRAEGGFTIAEPADVLPYLGVNGDSYRPNAVLLQVGIDPVARKDLLVDALAWSKFQKEVQCGQAAAGDGEEGGAESRRVPYVADNQLLGVKYVEEFYYPSAIARVINRKIDREKCTDLPVRGQPLDTPWLLWGSKGTYSSRHCEPHGSSIWCHLLCGQKEWWFLLPDNIDADPTIPSPTKRWFKVTQNPGETLIIPPGIEHVVRNACESVGVARNYVK